MSRTLLALWRREGRWALVIVILALIMRMLYLFQAREHLFFNYFADSLFYHGWALGIVEGQPGPTIFFQGPLYPYLLAVFYWFFGPRPEVVLWFQVLMGSASCGLIYLLGRLAFGRSVGLLAALMGALYGVEIFHEGALLMTTVLYALNLLLLISIFWALRQKNGMAGSFPALSWAFPPRGEQTFWRSYP
jgi:4-amino-4-deoxy-L-arabinose transferase-like glycosyltransferase